MTDNNETHGSIHQVHHMFKWYWSVIQKQMRSWSPYHTDDIYRPENVNRLCLLYSWQIIYNQNIRSKGHHQFWTTLHGFYLCIVAETRNVTKWKRIISHQCLQFLSNQWHRAVEHRSHCSRIFPMEGLKDDFPCYISNLEVVLFRMITPMWPAVMTQVISVVEFLYKLRHN